MQFVFQNLAWGFLLLAVPLLIHLINLLRYQRVQWAAMQFLLESYRRNRRWVWMKQMLLLLSRMAVLGLLVAMLAQWVSGARLLSLLGQTVTHHYVLLDDSMSMGQSTREGSAYQRGIRGISNLLDRASQDGGSHQLTLIRFSRAAVLDPTSGKADSADTSQVDAVADILSRTIVGKTEELLASLPAQGTVDIDVDGQSALQMTQTLLTNAPTNENAIIYCVSDFREKDWAQPGALKTGLGNLEKQGAKLQLLDCGESNVENISIVSLTPDDEVLAAGVPVLLRLTVKNNGLNEARNLNLRVTSYDFQSQNLNIAFDQISSGESTELPPLLIDRLGPGESTTRSVQVVFPESGSHVVSASCGDDALASDNRANCVLNIVESQKLLVVDDTADRKAAVYLRSALAPGEIARTGWKVETESSAFVRDNPLESLMDFSVVLLADVNNLDDRSLRNLQRYVAAGGGLGIFPGQAWQNTDAVRISQLLMKAPANDAPENPSKEAALLPVGLKSIREFTAEEIENLGLQTLTVEKHPIFEPLLNLSSSPFQFIRFFRVVETSTAEDSSEPDSSTRQLNSGRVIARLGNDIPLIIDHAVGQGHVVLFTTAIDPAWNTWAQDPSVVVVLLKLSGYLASFRREPTSQPVTSEVVHLFSPRDYLPDVELVVPNRGSGARQSIQLKGTAINDRLLQAKWDPKAAPELAEQGRPLQAGVRELWLTSLSKGREVINFAVNSPAREGELRKIGKEDLSERLEPIRYQYQTVSDSLEANPFSSASSQQNLLFALLILMLIIEQALAYWASYHLPARTSATATNQAGASA